MSKTFRKLSEPLKIGAMELKNRIVMAALNNNYTRGGFMTDLSVDFYVSRARGGAGMIVIEASSVDYPRSRSVLNPAIDDDKYIPKFKEIADGVHLHGGRVVVQLSHVGRQTRKRMTGQTPIAPSPVATRSPLYPETPRELSLGEIRDIILKFGDAAFRAKRAGLDGVEVIMGHGYLPNNFLTPAANVRKDEYGGFKGGIKFCTDIVKEIKKSCGDDFPVFCRINGDDYLMRGGNTPVEAQMLATELERAGADGISVSAGMRDSDLNFNDHTSASPRGGWIHLAERIKKVIHIPVIAVKRLTPEMGEQILEEGKADLVAFGKAFIADPNLANKILEGNLEDIIPCTSCCQGCYDTIWMLKPITCMLNPRIGRTNAAESSLMVENKRIMVVGGGPAGCAVAQFASERGHKVTLLEKSPSIGGNYQLCTHSPSKKEMARVFPYFSHVLKRNEVEVRTGTEFIPELLDDYKPDVLVLATGADFRMPGVKGIDLPHVMSPLEAITGSKETGDYVVIWTCSYHCTWTCGIKSRPIPDDIVGITTSESYACTAGHAAVDTAEALAAQGKIVTLITERDALVPGMGFTNRGNLFKRFYQANVKVSNSVMVKEIKPEGIVCEKEGIQFLLHADSLVVSVGMKGRGQPEELAGGRVREVHRVGDCREIGNALTAIHGAFELAQSM
jgi:2,4-dienoyl-CoA reductase (NADPH2)